MQGWNANQYKNVVQREGGRSETACVKHAVDTHFSRYMLTSRAIKRETRLDLSSSVKISSITWGSNGFVFSPTQYWWLSCTILSPDADPFVWCECPLLTDASVSKRGFFGVPCIEEKAESFLVSPVLHQHSDRWNLAYKYGKTMYRMRYALHGENSVLTNPVRKT